MLAAKDTATVEDLLRWPLQGPQGIERTTKALNRLFVMKPLRASQFTGDGPIRLADGHALSFAWIRQLSGSVDIGVAKAPCFPVERAATMIGAVLSPVTHNDHGIDLGRTYDVVKNGVRVRLGTLSGDYRCLDSIGISPSEG